jgi:hypothetical protein
MELHLNLVSLIALAVKLRLTMAHILEEFVATTTAILSLRMDFMLVVIVVVNHHHHQMDFEHLLFYHHLQMDFIQHCLLVAAVAAIAVGCLVADNSSSLSFRLIFHVLIII